MVDYGSPWLALPYICTNRSYHLPCGLCMHKHIVINILPKNSTHHPEVMAQGKSTHQMVRLFCSTIQQLIYSGVGLTDSLSSAPMAYRVW